MSEWITDRRPTEKDVERDTNNEVWAWNGVGCVRTHIAYVGDGQPWQPIECPKRFDGKRWSWVADESNNILFRHLGNIQFSVNTAVLKNVDTQANAICDILNNVASNESDELKKTNEFLLDALIEIRSYMPLPPDTYEWITSVIIEANGKEKL